MLADFWNWLLGVIISTGLLGFAAYLMRDTIGKFLAKAVEHRFDKKLETFKADLRDNERELEQIRSFLVSAHRERDAAILAKRLDAAETLLRARHAISQLSILVEYMKTLNVETLLKDGDDPRIAEFINLLIKPIDIDEKIKFINSIDQTSSQLYLSERTLKLFSVYSGIVLNAAMMMKIFSIPIREKNKMIKAGNLSKSIIELVPASKEGFDKWGEGYAYIWSTYFYDEVLRALRHEVSGSDDMTRDTESVERLALDSRRAQINIRTSLEQVGLSEDLLKPKGSDSAIASTAQKVAG